MDGKLTASSKTPLKSIAVNQFGVSRVLKLLFDHRSGGPCFLGSPFSLRFLGCSPAEAPEESCARIWVLLPLVLREHVTGQVCASGNF